MTDPPKIATHDNPVWRDRTNFIVKLDLAPYGMPGSLEQFWTRTDDHQHFELCCIPFFTYGQSLGDILRVALGTGRHSVHGKSGHQTIRFAFTDDHAAHDRHEDLHAALVGRAECLVEYRNGGHYGAIDIDDHGKADAVIALLAPLQEARALIWEWADPVQGT